MELLQVTVPMALEVLVFFVKAAIIIAGLLLIISFAMKDKQDDKLLVKNVNKRFKSYRRALLSSWLDKKPLKKQLKEEDETEKKNKEGRKRAFFLHFKGDLKASESDTLKETVSAVLSVASADDEVILGLESPGGMVHGYGLAASQLQRIKDAGIPLTVCVDKVAASGGYMMACLADKIIAAPFSVIGSVGVVATVPNFNKILKKNDVDYYQVTSGRYKRTVTLLGEVTPDGVEKFKEEIEETHELFKNHIKKFRPQVDIEKIATGEHWYGTQALDLKLVDELGTCDDYLFRQCRERDVKEICFHPKKSMKDKLTEGFALAFDKVFDRLLERLQGPPSL